MVTSVRPLPRRGGSVVSGSAGGDGCGLAFFHGTAPLTTNDAALVLGQPAPDPELLVRGDGELEALSPDRALRADRLGRRDLRDGRTGHADRKEQVRVD